MGHKKICKMPRNISGEINLDKELEGFLLESYKCGLWECLVSLPQMENAQICIQIIIHCHNSIHCHSGIHVATSIGYT